MKGEKIFGVRNVAELSKNGQCERNLTRFKGKKESVFGRGRVKILKNEMLNLGHTQ